MKKVLLDSSVLFSASQSRSSISAIILALCHRHKLQGFVSPYIIAEIKRNAASKLDQKAKQRLNIYLLQAKLKLTTPTQEEIAVYAKIIKPKDAHVLAAARKCGANYLITLDTHDFMITKVKKFLEPIKIITPKDFLKREF